MNMHAQWLVIAALSICLVPVASAKKVTIKMVKEDPTMEFDYVVDEGTKDSGVQLFKGTEKKITFDDQSPIKILRIMIPGRAQQTLNLLSTAEQKKGRGTLIFISSLGVPTYWTLDNYKTFRAGQRQSKL